MSSSNTPNLNLLKSDPVGDPMSSFSIQTMLNDNWDKIDASVKTLATGTGTPIGVITPTVIGEMYNDQATGIVYTANGLTNTSWVIPIEYYGMALQASINSDYQVAQTETSFTNPANQAYTLDMNVVVFANTGTLPTTIVHSQAALTSDEVYKSKFAYNINVNGVGSGFGASDAYGVAERIEHGVQALCGNGKKITISKMFKSDIAGKRIAVGLKQVYGTGGSPSAAEILTPTATTIRTLTSSMVLYTWTFTTNTLTGKIFGTNNDDYLEYTEYVMWGATFATNNLGGGTAETFVGSGNITSTQKQINVGDAAFPFQPKSYNDELLACQRHFQILFPQLGQSTFGNGMCTTTTRADFALLHSEMRIAPTITFTAPSDFTLFISGVTLNTATAISAGIISKVSYNVTVTVASGLTQGQACQLFGANPNAKITFDARL